MKKPSRPLIPYSKKHLYDPRRRLYTGEDLARIAFPLGGIGTGTISLGGRGNLQDWEVWNSPNKGARPNYTLPVIWARAAGGKPVTKVLERRLLPPYDTAFGLSPSDLAGMPRMDETVFSATYPLAGVGFFDTRLPLNVNLSACSPFIPMDPENSGLPAAILVYTVENPGPKRVDAAIVWSMENCCGWGGSFEGIWAGRQGLGMNVNEFARGDGFAGLKMTSKKHAPDSMNFGSFALVTDHPGVTWQAAWTEQGWWDRAQRFWDRPSKDGSLEEGPTLSEPSPDGATWIGSLGVRFSLEPGQEAQVPFVIAWHVPNRQWKSCGPEQPRIVRNHYATRFHDAWDVASHVMRNYGGLWNGTLAFVNQMADSTLPGKVIEAVTATASIMRTTTCMWLDDGRLYAFEGCGEKEGCCPMNCSHVWNYEQALAHLFPSLERTMRDTDFLHNMHPETGAMAFRTAVPGAEGKTLWNIETPACDGQNGTILKLYREWQQCGDTDWLRKLWPNAKKAIEFAWGPHGWDRDGGGMLEWRQHNTYDIEFYGPNTFTGAFFLGALRAASIMAEAVGDAAAAEDYRRRFEASAAAYDAALWNGSYYEQKTADVDGKHPKYQYGKGCLSDHLLGQWFCEVVGLGKVLRPARVKKALQSIFAANFRADLLDHCSVQRVYALNEEAGLLLCTWPRGGREQYPFPYCDEVWTGIEYQVAAHLIFEGFIDEGLAIVAAIRDRHDGRKRNPWNESECGNHYARAMSSWSLLAALAGYRYSAVEQSMRIAPKVNQKNFRCFFAAGTAWGSFSHKFLRNTLTVRLDVSWGGTQLRKISIAWPAEQMPRAVSGTVVVGDQPATATIAINGSERAVVVEFASAQPLRVGEPVQISVRAAR